MDEQSTDRLEGQKKVRHIFYPKRGTLAVLVVLFKTFLLSVYFLLYVLLQQFGQLC